MPIFETIVIVLLVLIFLKLHGWGLKLTKKEIEEQILFHPNPKVPGGGHFEFPISYDLKKLFYNQNKEREDVDDNKKEDKNPAGYA